MPGRGPAPKPAGERRRTNVPAGGEWQDTQAEGWQHGPIPEPPDGLLAASLEAWRVWLGSWFGAHWTPADLPGLRRLILLYDAVERGELQRSAELRMLMDTYGVTPKGQQDRRWAPPVSAPVVPTRTHPAGRYKHLKAVEPGAVES